MSDAENRLSNDELLGDTIVSSKEGVEMEKRQECLN